METQRTIQKLAEAKDNTIFASPKNFPDDIANAIKAGKMRGMVACLPYLLTDDAWKAYQRILKDASHDYYAARDVAYKIFQQEEPPDSTQKIARQKVTPAWSRYMDALDATDAKYHKVKANAFWDLFDNIDNRVEAWR